MECYPHDSLVTSAVNCNPTNLCDNGIVSWRYYAPLPGSIWDAPENIPEVCYGENSGYGNPPTPCASPEFTNHVAFPTKSHYQGAPIFSDITNCHLQQLSWVIPDEQWSDHPGSYETGLGPDYVADIVNSIGKSPCTDQPSGQTYWQDTAIFITWDDWGGFYDHIVPPAVYRSTMLGVCNDPHAPYGWGCGYVYGFRVPLLVVSRWTPAGYVSGACTGTGSGGCPNDAWPGPYVHDFGSILAFIEHNFVGMQFIAPQGYADYNAPDGYQYDGINAVPLYDFFGLCCSPANARSFTPIYVPANLGPTYFEDYYYQTGLGPIGPDDVPDPD